MLFWILLECKGNGCQWRHITCSYADVRAKMLGALCCSLGSDHDLFKNSVVCIIKTNTENFSDQNQEWKGTAPSRTCISLNISKCMIVSWRAISSSSNCLNVNFAENIFMGTLGSGGSETNTAASSFFYIERERYEFIIYSAHYIRHEKSLFQGSYLINHIFANASTQRACKLVVAISAEAVVNKRVQLGV